MRQNSHRLKPHRLLWLKDHPETWDLPSRQVIEMMRTDGLYAPTTYWKDCVNGLQAMIALVREAR